MTFILNTGKQPIAKRIRFAIRWAYTGVMSVLCAIAASIILEARRHKTGGTPK